MKTEPTTRLPASPPLSSSDLLGELRAQQAERVMPLIGGLLDFWDQLPGDLQTDPELEKLAKQILAIDAAMELSPNH